MRGNQYFLLCLFLCLSISSSAIPDSLQQQLNTVDGASRLNVWNDWADHLLGDSLDHWEPIVQEACSDAYQFMEQDSALEWCYHFHERLKIRYTDNNRYSKILEVLEVMKPIADTLAKKNGGYHSTLVNWYKHYGWFHYTNRDMKKAEANFQKALELNKIAQNESLFFSLWRALGIMHAFGEEINKGLEYLAIADSMATKLKYPFRDVLTLKYYQAYTHGRLEEYKKADHLFEFILDSLHYETANTAERIKIDYAKNLCLSGKTTKGIAYLNQLNIYVDTLSKHINQATYAEAQCDCAILDGDLTSAYSWNNIIRSLMISTYDERRNEELLAWQAKFKTSEKEAEIHLLENEKLLEQTQYRNKVTIISILALLGGGILFFLLLLNKNKQKELVLNLERDRQITENRDRLFSSITHDIRTPLTLMMAPLERAGSGPVEERVKTDIKLAMRNGKRLMELFNQILDWNKAEAKALTLSPQLGQLGLVLNALCRRFEQQAEESQLKFMNDLNFAKDYILMDFDKLDKILSNLIGNAIKFCEAGEVIRLSGFIKNEYLCLEISDDGPGIEVSEQEKVFQNYTQGIQGKIKGGTGIGLALVKELVSLMKGEIEIKSDPGKGTTFNLSLPFESVSDNILLEEKTEKGKTVVTEDKEKPVVLIVEDEPELLNFLYSALVDKYEVEVAHSSAIGLSIAISRIPDIIISDWMLPDHTGEWLCNEIHKNELIAHIPVLILTAYNADTYRQLAFEAGAVAWMNKPFKLDLLYKQLETLLAQQERVRENWSGKFFLEEKQKSNEQVIEIDPFLQSIMELLEVHHSDEFFSVEKMAKLMLLSRVQLFRKIKKITGESPSSLIRKYRLNKARLLLKQPGQNVSQVSFAVGFSDPNYFSRAYKQHFNIAPSQDLYNAK